MRLFDLIEYDIPFRTTNSDCCIESVGRFWKLKLDVDVYLPTFDINLQRPYVWNLTQKREFIRSFINGMNIPPVALIKQDKEDGEVIYEVIDGKQRLGAITDFVNEKFSLPLGDVDYFYSQLDVESRRFFNSLTILGWLAFSYPDEPISDVDKIKWFRYINYAGTPQDHAHLVKLERFRNKKVY